MKELQNLKKIDIHTHFYGYWESAITKKLDERTVELYQKFNIQKAGISILGSNGKNSELYVTTHEDVVLGNKELLKAMQKFPDFVIGFVYVNPAYGKQSLDLLKEYYEQHGVKGVKLGAAMKCTDPRVFPLVERCIEYDLPIYHHLGHHLTVDHYVNIPSDSTDYAELAKRFPEAKLIMAHIGGGGDWRWAIRAVKDTPNVTIDISGSCNDIGMVEFAVKELGADRVAFGTDITVFSSIAKIEYAKISMEEKKNVCWDNAAKLLKL